MAATRFDVWRFMISPETARDAIGIQRSGYPISGVGIVLVSLAACCAGDRVVALQRTQGENIE
jgi:(p)ppGpp synthase/HD superfamily hydrolase